MLPNFRKTEPDATRVQSGFAANDQPSAFPARPFLAVNRGQERAGVSVIGPDLIITGNLISKGEVQVDGTVQGDIHGSHIVIGQTANISGGIVAEEIVIRGHVSGSVRGKRVMLQASSQVDGDIYHNALSIEQGAMFEGKSRRTTEDPRAGATLSDVALPASARSDIFNHALAAPAPHLSEGHEEESEASVTIVPPRLPSTPR
ncbi:MAG: polymer-forming cytoskeletal protein [Hyphomicrobium sp.]